MALTAREAWKSAYRYARKGLGIQIFEVTTTYGDTFRYAKTDPDDTIPYQGPGWEKIQALVKKAWLAHENRNKTDSLSGRAIKLYQEGEYPYVASRLNPIQELPF